MHNFKLFIAGLCLALSIGHLHALADEAASTDAPEQAETVAESSESAVNKVDLSQLPAAPTMADISYAIGFTIGSDMAQRGADLDVDQIAEGIKAGMGVEESRLNQQQLATCLITFQMQMQQRYMQEAQDNLAKGQAYLAENASKEGVNVTESGLQYKVIEEGDGPTPTLNDVVQARYRGTLIDGTEFDQSGEEPVSFPVAQVIPGWVEALQMMKVGDKWELTIPAELAYGEQGAPGGAIGPNQVLRFEIELVGIEPSQTGAEPANP
ncbi:MAG: hypothetical protein Kow00105_17650 [Phycisphaeraceae bacterium]